MGERHARVFRSQPHAQLVAIYDVDPERAAAVAALYGAQAMKSEQAFLAAVDAVSVATPTPQHFANVEACLAAGKPVLVEKAITDRVAHAERLTEQANRSGLLLMVGHIERYNPVFTELKRLIAASGEPPIALSFRRLSSFATSSQVVDVVLDLMIHDLDLMIDLCAGQELAHHHGVGRIVRTREIDHAVASVAFSSGPVASLFASRVTELKVREIEVTLPSVFLKADLLRKEILCYRNSRAAYWAANGGVLSQQRTHIEQVQIPAAEPLALEIADFVNSVRTGKPPQVTAQQATKSLRLAFALRDQMLHKID